VVPEALARGIPVIATQGAPWSSLVAEACGWWIPPGEQPLAAALADAFSRSPKTLREMGEQGRRLVRDRYTWDRVATSMMELYEWTLGRGVEPAFVQR
jgi:glycosyltransferase involved in cell wall biosynthesis